MILVTGATGHLGTAVIDQLLKHTAASEIAAYCRDEAKAQPLKEKGIQVRLGDYNNPAALASAMQGVSKVLLISGADANRLAQQKAVVDAAKAAGVQHIVYTSIVIKDIASSAIQDFLQSHYDTEQHIIESGMAYTFLRNSLYTDVIRVFSGPDAVNTGIFLPAGEGKVPYALRAEMGEAAANVLLQSGHERKTYNITGNTLHSFQDIAQALSDLSGKAVTYTDADSATFPDHLQRLGVQPMGIFIGTGFSADIKAGQYEIVGNDLAQLLGREPAGLQEGLKAVFSL